MKAIIFILSLLFLTPSLVHSKANTVDLFADALLTGNAATLEKVLAPNYWYIGANGHIRDKNHFISEIRDKKLAISRLSLSNMRETQVGSTRLLTFNGFFSGKSELPLPDGLMRFSMVLADNHGVEQIVLFQITPVIPTRDCEDGNCRIK